MPDAELYQQIAAIEGVAEVAVKYSDSVNNANTYLGKIYVDPQVDAAAVLDKSYAILRQGRPRASIIVSRLTPT